MKLTKTRLKQIIQEELRVLLEKKEKGMFGQPDFKSKVAWVKRNKPGVEDPDAYVAGVLRKTGEIE